VAPPEHVGPRVDPPWWDFARQVLIFALGLALIVYAATSPGHDIPFLITGGVLIGIVPVDRTLSRWTRPPPAAAPPPAAPPESP
jgi:hypothetical protein